jgi:thiol-disulfide isomerase/thioredoxin
VRRRTRGATLAAGLLAIALIAAACSSGSSPIPGTDGALHVPLTPLHGGPPVELTAYAGHPLIVNLWASWCTPCRAEMPRLEAASVALGSKATVVGLTTDSNDSALTAAAQRARVTYPLLVDATAKAQDDLAPGNLPATYFFDSGGHLVASHEGALSTSALAGYLSRLGLATDTTG